VRSSDRKARALWIVTIGYWLILFTLTHIPGEKLPHVPLSDKTEHLTGYGTLATLLYFSLWRSKPHLSNIGIVVLGIGMMYGAVDEWIQAIPFIHRDCDLLDWYADTTGLAIAVIVLTAFRALRDRSARS
jgi:VanZ family protein